MIMKSLLAGGVGVLLLMLHPGLPWAQTSDERIRQLEQDLSRMRQDVEALKKESGKPYKFPIDFGASITVRYDLTSIEDKADLRTDDARDGFRTRDRFWAEYNADGPVNAGLRISTGETPNPVSPFVRFGDLFRSKSFNLDQFWIAIHPMQFFDKRPREVLPADVALLLGRMPQPFWRSDWGTWRSEMIFDNDISPEGIAVQIKTTLSFGLQIVATGGYFVIEEVDDLRFSGLTKDTFLAAGQIKAEYKPIGALAVSLYGYNNINAGLFAPGFNPLTGGEALQGTAAFLLRDPGLQRTNNMKNFNAPGAVGFVSDTFNVLNITGQLHSPLPVLPALASLGPEIYLVGDYANNLSVGRSKHGYGITLGVRGGGREDSRVNPFHIWVTYRNVDNDATLATFADSDLGAGTGYAGIGTGINYRLHKNLLVQIAGFAFDGYPRKDNYWQRVFFDVVANF
jgi:hypothetical protein